MPSRFSHKRELRVASAPSAGSKRDDGRGPHHARGDKREAGARRALSDIGGPVQVVGEEATCGLLLTVLGADFDGGDSDASRGHVHGFHTYPGRMHPGLARRCVELFCPRRGRVLDPFCGSGTVLVESLLGGRAATGVDINPLSVMLARLKTTRCSKSLLQDIAAASKRVCCHAQDRRKQRVGASRRYGSQDVRMFAPHVLLELDGLRDGIDQLRDGFVRDAMLLVLSSILIKVSDRVSDTVDGYIPKRLAAGFATRIFEQRVQELVERLAMFARALPSGPVVCDVRLGDARRLRFDDADGFDLVLTSPPYAGTYDYVAHHEARMRWLGLSSARMLRGELGSRRQLQGRDFEAAVEEFRGDMHRVLRGLARALVRDGRVVVVVGDSVVSQRALRADEVIADAAHNSGLRWLATASQPRVHFHRASRGAYGPQGRYEHVVVFAR